MRTILLVDDERLVLEPMKVVLEDEYRVLLATGGEEALGLLSREPVELVIADQRMPVMTGVQFLARVRERYPEVVRLLLTAYTDFDALMEAINTGRVYRYILKPWDPDDMRLTIRQALEWNDMRTQHGQLAADLTEAHGLLRQRTEDLERTQVALVRTEKLAAVGRFAAEMGHEMNNCLQIILWLNDSLARASGVEKADVRELEAQVRILAEIVAHIRDFALGAALPFEPQMVDPRSVVQDAIGSCHRHPAFRGVTLMARPDGPVLWRLDRRQAKHLLLNLLKNAARVSPQGAVVELKMRTAGDELVFEVIDHGPGVPVQLRQRIFEPFYTDDPDGSGLGLSICLQVTEAHGGRIEVGDTPGGGATFSVFLPPEPPAGV